MRLSLHARIAVGGIAGIAAGTACHLLFRDAPGLAAFVTYVSQPVGQVFLRLLLMLVVPLVFSALALGVAGLGDLRSVGRVGLKTLAYTVGVSTIAVLIGPVARAAPEARRRHAGRDPAARARALGRVRGQARQRAGAEDGPRAHRRRSCPTTRSRRRRAATTSR
jgi:DAACS family dicarboxylate/amino acid:cation (Na+ or H+) symporter